MAGRFYYPQGYSSGTTRERRVGEGSQTIPTRPPYNQAAHGVPEENNAHFNPDYNQSYDRDTYVNNNYFNNSDYYNGDPDNYEVHPAYAEGIVRDYNYQDYHNEEPNNYDQVYSNTNSNQNSGNNNNFRNYYDTNNQVENNQQFNNFDIDMRENNLGNQNSTQDKRRFQEFVNFQDEVSPPVTLKNIREIVAELLEPQPDRPIKFRNNVVNGRERNFARPPSPRPGSSRGPSESAGGTGVARSHERDYFPERPSGLSDSEWRAMFNTFIQSREARGAIPPVYSDNNSCPSPSHLDEAEEYMDEYENEPSNSGLSI